MKEHEIKYWFKRASNEFVRLNTETNGQELPPTEPKRNKAESLGSPVQGEEEGMARTTVCFRGFRVRPLDPDNHAASCKDLLDGLSRCGIIRDDSSEEIRLVCEQVKVKHYSEEKIEIEITYP